MEKRFNFIKKILFIAVTISLFNNVSIYSVDIEQDSDIRSLITRIKQLDLEGKKIEQAKEALEELEQDFSLLEQKYGEEEMRQTGLRRMLQDKKSGLKRIAEFRGETSILQPKNPEIEAFRMQVSTFNPQTATPGELQALQSLYFDLVYTYNIPKELTTLTSKKIQEFEAKIASQTILHDKAVHYPFMLKLLDDTKEKFGGGLIKKKRSNIAMKALTQKIDQIIDKVKINFTEAIEQYLKLLKSTEFVWILETDSYYKATHPDNITSHNPSPKSYSGTTEEEKSFHFRTNNIIAPRNLRGSLLALIRFMEENEKIKQTNETKLEKLKQKIIDKIK